MRKIIIYLVVLLVVSPQVLLSQQTGEVNKVGTTAANFLKLEVGARAAALAGAFTAVADDASAIKWNPAGMAYVNQFTLSYNNIDLYAGIKHQFFSAIFPVGNNVLGVSVNMVDIGKILKTTITDPDGDTGLYFDSSNMAVAVSYARPLTDRVTIGVSARWIHEQIWQEHAYGYCADVGVLYKPGVSGMRLGMSITNFGPDMSMDFGPLQTFQKNPAENMEGVGNRDIWAQWRMEAYPMPVSFQLGGIIDLVGSQSFLFKNEANRASLMIEVNDSFDNQMRSKYGIEYEWKQILAIRGGYKANYDVATFTFGGGFQIPVRNMSLRFDYAYADYGDLGNVNVTTLTLGF